MSEGDMQAGAYYTLGKWLVGFGTAAIPVIIGFSLGMNTRLHAVEYAIDSQKAWNISHRDFHQERQSELAKQFASVDTRLARIDERALRVDQIEYRLTQVENGQRQLTQDINETLQNLRKDFSTLASDVRVLSEAMRRSEARQAGSGRAASSVEAP